jgi:hypothetical protein
MIALNNEINNDSFLFRQQTRQEFYTTRQFNIISVCEEKNQEPLSIRNASIYNAIKDFLQLPNNWDNDNAIRPEIGAVDQALSIVEKVNFFGENVYFTSPGPNGEISIELKNGNREAELIVYENKKVFLKFEDNNFIEQGALENLDEILTWLDGI